MCAAPGRSPTSTGRGTVFALRELASSRGRTAGADVRRQEARSEPEKGTFEHTGARATGGGKGVVKCDATDGYGCGSALGRQEGADTPVEATEDDVLQEDEGRARGERVGRGQRRAGQERKRARFLRFERGGYRGRDKARIGRGGLRAQAGVLQEELAKEHRKFEERRARFATQERRAGSLVGVVPGQMSPARGTTPKSTLVPRGTGVAREKSRATMRLKQSYIRAQLNADIDKAILKREAKLDPKRPNKERNIVIDSSSRLS